MTMSGWAPTDKQPWHHGEPYTSINRRYIHLRERLLPYLYTYAALAHRHGVGPVRPLWWAYPDDPATLADDVRYEFLCGDAFLVAPVYEDADVRCAWQRCTFHGDEVTIGPSAGRYLGQPERRTYRIRVHDGGAATVVETPPVNCGDSLTVRLSGAGRP